MVELTRVSLLLLRAGAERFGGVANVAAPCVYQHATQLMIERVRPTNGRMPLATSASDKRMYGIMISAPTRENGICSILLG